MSGVRPRKQERSVGGEEAGLNTCVLEAGRRLGASLGAEAVERDGEKNGRHRPSPW